MQAFVTTREAKEFLIDRIVSEARQENTLLTETERKMLYFSETAPTLPDIWQVNADFERDYDEEEYEQKIGALIWNLRKRAKRENPGELREWDAAVRLLRSEDHYLLVLIDVAGPPSEPDQSNSPPWWSYVLGIAIGIAVFAYIWFR